MSNDYFIDVILYFRFVSDMLSQYIFRVVAVGLFCLSSLAVQAMPRTTTPTPQKEVPVFGHLNPDTDTIVTSIVFAKWLQSNNVNAKPYRLGELNRETKFVLNTAGVVEPDMLPENLPEDTEVALVDHNESKIIKKIKQMMKRGLSYLTNN